VLPHRGVHRRRDQYRRCAGQVCGRQEVIGYAVRELRQGVGCSRRYDQQIDGLRERYVGDGIRIIRSVVINQDEEPDSERKVRAG